MKKREEKYRKRRAVAAAPAAGFGQRGCFRLLCSWRAASVMFVRCGYKLGNQRVFTGSFPNSLTHTFRVERTVKIFRVSTVFRGSAASTSSSSSRGRCKAQLLPGRCFRKFISFASLEQLFEFLVDGKDKGKVLRDVQPDTMTSRCKNVVGIRL